MPSLPSTSVDSAVDPQEPQHVATSRRQELADAALAQLTMDRETIERLKKVRDHRTHTRVVPLLRLTAFLVVSLAVGLHNAIVFGDGFGAATVNLTAYGVIYSLLTLGILRAFYRPSARPHLGRVFLRTDLIFLGALVYATGGPKSLVFFAPYFRVADQTSAGSRWCYELTALAVVAHVGALAASVWIGGAELNVGVEAMKVLACTIGSLYLATAARATDKVRRRNSATVSLARDLLDELRGKSKDLEAAKQAAEDAVLAKGLFLANMSHELRTPMNGIIGMTDLALATEVSQEQEGYLSTVRSSAQNLLAIVDDILDFSKIESGHLELEHEPFSLRRCVREALDVTAGRGFARGLDVTCDVSPELRDGLVGDALRIRQVLVNLVSNAIKFTETGHVTIRVEADTSSNLDGVRFSVEDSGVGIAQEKLAKIFEAFTQAEQSTTRRFGGTGLGLAISKDLVDRMDGTFEVISEEGSGSEFRFTLPLPRATRRVEDEAALGPVDAESRRAPVLLVVPSDRTRRSIEKQLESWDVDVQAHDSIASARRWHETSGACPMLVIVDANLDPSERTSLDVALKGTMPSGPGWIMLQSTPGLRAEGIEEERRRNVVLPAVGPDLRQALEQLSTLAPIRPCPSAEEAPREQEETANAFSLAHRKKKKRRGKQSARPLDVLLVEDNPVNQRVARLLLESWGHTVEVAGNGQLALDALESHSFAAVLMDMQMPVMDGIQATRELRAREAETGASRVWVVAMTANAMRGDAQSCFDAGMDDYVPKPIDAELLFEKLEAVGAKL